MQRYAYVIGLFSVLPGAIWAEPDNDNFANAIPLGGPLPILATGTNVGATLEPGEPDHDFGGGFYASSVWWKWTAPADGSYMVDTLGSGIDSVIAIYSESGEALVQIARDDDGAGFALASAAQIYNASAGQEFYIAVLSFDDTAQGSIALRISRAPGAGEFSENNDFANATSISGSVPQTVSSLNGYTFTFIPPGFWMETQWLTTEVGETAVDGYPHTAWWQYTPTVDERVRVRSNDWSSSVGVFTGSALGDLILESETEPVRETRITLYAGTTYYLRVSLDSPYYPSLAVLDLFPVPLNDDFASAFLLAGPGTVSQTNAGAGLETGEPGRGPGYVSDLDHSVWWKWTAGSTDLAVFDTIGSAIDTVLHVFEGPDLASLTLVRASDDADESLISRVAFFPQTGSTYYIRVAGNVSDYDSIGEGDLTLNFSTFGAPTSAADHLRYGRAHMEGRDAASLTAANHHFSQALGLEPVNEAAHVLNAVTRMAALQQHSSLATLLSQWGIQVNSAGLQKIGYDTGFNGLDRTAPVGSDLSQSQTFLATTVFNEIDAADAQLANAAVGFTLALSDSEVARKHLTVDEGDINILRAMGHAMQAMIHLNNTLNTDGSLQTLTSLENTANFNAESVLAELPNALRRRGVTDERPAFKSKAQLANTHYQAGSTFIRNRPNGAEWEHHLFRIGAGRAGKEQNLRENFASASAALDAPTMWSGKLVSLSPLLTTNSDFRDLLPQFEGDKVLPETVPDPTLLTAISNGTQTEASTRLIDNNLLYNFNSFTQWVTRLLGSFAPADQALTANAAGGALNNGANWAFVLDPADPNDDGAAVLNSVIPGDLPSEHFFTVVFKRRIGVPGLVYRVCVSDDLVTWDETESQIEQVGAPVTQPDGLTEQVTFRVTSSVTFPSKKFVQVKAILPNP